MHNLIPVNDLQALILASPSFHIVYRDNRQNIFAKVLFNEFTCVSVVKYLLAHFKREDLWEPAKKYARSWYLDRYWRGGGVDGG